MTREEIIDLKQVILIQKAINEELEKKMKRCKKCHSPYLYYLMSKSVLIVEKRHEDGDTLR